MKAKKIRPVTPGGLGKHQNAQSKFIRLSFYKGADIIEKSMLITQLKNNSQTDSVTIVKRIGSTNYRLGVHFSETSKETVNDKISRLIKNETVD